MKAGSRLKSAVCSTEVLVIKASEAAITCGGHPMREDVAEEKLEIDPAHADGTLMGKRYTDAAGSLELLCIKPGAGSLAADGEKLAVKDAKPLPSSD